MEFLERADQAAIHLLRIINDFLDISKISSPGTAQPAAGAQGSNLQLVHIQQKACSL